jgi:transcriptional regulator with XRE-family HTH domain
LVAAPERWTGHEARLLRMALRLSLRAFAARLGVAERTVSKWESAGRSTTPWPESQSILDTALAQASEDARARFAQFVDVGAAEAMRPAKSNHGEEDDTNRRDATRLIGLTVAAATPPAFDAVDWLAHSRGRGAQYVDHKLVQGHREVAQAFAGLYRSADPRSVLPVAIAYADDVLVLLDASMSDQDRTELGGIVAGIHAQIGLWACHLHRPAVAYRYLATACQVAEGTSDPVLQARTLGALSYLFSSAPRGGHGGDVQRAVMLLTKAMALIGRADSFTVGWLATWRADQYATSGDLDAAQRDIDVADRELGRNDDGTAIGFFARSVYGYGMREHCDSVRAFTLALAGQIDEADRAFNQVQFHAANIRRRVATYGHQALAQVRTGEPEMACATLSQAVDLAIDNYYVMGLERAFGVRASFDPSWSLACVRALDEQLHQPRS